MDSVILRLLYSIPNVQHLNQHLNSLVFSFRIHRLKENTYGNHSEGKKIVNNIAVTSVLCESAHTKISAFDEVYEKTIELHNE